MLPQMRLVVLFVILQQLFELNNSTKHIRPVSKSFAGQCKTLGGNSSYEKGECEAWDMNVIPLLTNITTDDQIRDIEYFLYEISKWCDYASFLQTYKPSIWYDGCDNYEFRDIYKNKTLIINAEECTVPLGKPIATLLANLFRTFSCVRTWNVNVGHVTYIISTIPTTFLESMFSSFLKIADKVEEELEHRGCLLEFIFYIEKNGNESYVKDLLKAFEASPYVTVTITKNISELTDSMRTCQFPEEPLVRKKNDSKGATLNDYNAVPKAEKINDEWRVEDCEVHVLKNQMLGKGAFAVVYKGILSKNAAIRLPYKTINETTTSLTTEVAVKTLKIHSDSAARAEFFREIEFMKKLGYHSHVLEFFGYVANEENPKIILHYCTNGSLLSYLRKFKDIVLEIPKTDTDIALNLLYTFAWQICDGMNYLNSLCIVHRDLAARNVLLTEDLTAKISDFGLCRNVTEMVCGTGGGKLPVKWMAIELLKQQRLNLWSDVWSFGVVLFEIFSLGCTPYPSLEPLDVLSYLEAGNRLEKPNDCPEKMYEIMHSCWLAEPSSRPTFGELQDELCEILREKDEDYGYLFLENRCT